VKATIGDVPWDDIRDIRILVDHNYHRVDYDILWRTLTDDVPHLRGRLKDFHETSQRDGNGSAAVPPPARARSRRRDVPESSGRATAEEFAPRTSNTPVFMLVRSWFLLLAMLAALTPGIAAAAPQDITAGQWRFAVGDDLARAAVPFDDSSWRTIDVRRGWTEQGIARLGFGWYRTRIHPSAQVHSAPMTTLSVEIAEGSKVWVYVDGVLRGTSGTTPTTIAMSAAELTADEVVIAVRALCGGQESFVGYEPCGLAGRVRLQPGSTTAEAAPFVLTTDRIGNLNEPGATLNIFADVLNSTTASRRFTLGASLGGAQAPSSTATVDRGQRHRFVVPFSSTRRGPVEITARLSESGETLATRTMTIGVADSPAAADPRFGLNTLHSDQIAAALGGEMFGDPALAARAGASWLRASTTPWKDVESEPGRRDWDLTDALKHAADAAGLDMVWNMLGVPYWALGYPSPNIATRVQSDLWCPPKARSFDDFARFHADAAARYPGDVWEIGNEPELVTNNYCWRQPEFRFSDVRAYSDLLARTNAAVRASDPTARVMTAALETISDPVIGEPAFAGTVMDEHSFDVFNIHIYSDESTVAASSGYRTAASANTMLVDRGLSDEVWATEYGGGSGGSLQAQRLAASRLGLQLLAGGADRIAFFYTVEYPGEPLSGTSLFDTSGSPRPALFSFLTMTRMLSGLPFTGIVSIGGVPAVRFSDGSRTVSAIWDDSGATIPLSADVQVFDDWGNPVPHGATLKLSATPKWLVGA
jgi:hypothetical protein